jgi:hypothetical protein
MPSNQTGFPEDFRPQPVGLPNAAQLAQRPPAEIAAYFREHPADAKQLCVECGDKRWTPSTYIDASRGVYHVGWLSREIRRNCEAVFDNLADAATDYLLFSLGKSRWTPRRNNAPKDTSIVYNSGASDEAIAALVAAAPVDLGMIYLAFLRRSNGASGDLGIQPGSFVLWGAEELRERNQEYNKLAGRSADFFAFGSAGTSKVLVFDLRDKVPWPVMMLDAARMKLDEGEQAARDFVELVGVLGRSVAEARD